MEAHSELPSSEGNSNTKILITGANFTQIVYSKTLTEKRDLRNRRRALTGRSIGPSRANTPSDNSALNAIRSGTGNDVANAEEPTYIPALDSSSRTTPRTQWLGVLLMSFLGISLLTVFKFNDHIYSVRLQSLPFSLLYSQNSTTKDIPPPETNDSQPISTMDDASASRDAAKWSAFEALEEARSHSLQTFLVKSIVPLISNSTCPLSEIKRVGKEAGDLVGPVSTSILTLRERLEKELRAVQEQAGIAANGLGNVVMIFNDTLTRIITIDEEALFCLIQSKEGSSRPVSRSSHLLTLPFRMLGIVHTKNDDLGLIDVFLSRSFDTALNAIDNLTIAHAQSLQQISDLEKSLHKLQSTTTTLNSGVSTYDHADKGSGAHRRPSSNAVPSEMHKITSALSTLEQVLHFSGQHQIRDVCRKAKSYLRIGGEGLGALKAIVESENIRLPLAGPLPMAPVHAERTNFVRLAVKRLEESSEKTKKMQIALQNVISKV
ncbi:hypothetical protein CVT24_012058 [Panaeolus cyanescens]|uniref:Uncharacterized protein n=1 Tax=Panaeolus cyanescens TaxID=181874 RepID=A0A409VHW9_9AGAR|nr:hypothetical protein CVT24_012058 [Panaeolus cyanescens]